MEYLTLKHGDLRVSRICMGGCPMGQYGWGEVRESELLDAVCAAVDHGVNFFDTADTYGLGTSEQTLAKALGARRNDVVIATKFGVRVENGKTFYDNRPEWIEQALAGSLRRLGREYVDLYQIHYRDGKTPVGEVVEKLKELRKKGYLRYFGLSNIHREDLEELLPWKEEFVSFQDEYSLACRKNEADIQAARAQLALTPMTWGSLGQGILTGKYGRDAAFAPTDRRSREIYVNFHGKKLAQNLEIVEVLRRIAGARQKPVAAAAIRFILDKFPDSVVLCGAKRPSQILSNLESLDWSLKAEELAALERVSQPDGEEEAGGGDRYDK